MSEGEAEGTTRMVLGHGLDGMFAHVNLLVRVVPYPGRYSVTWQVDKSDLPAEARARTEGYLTRYLASYIEKRPFGLEVRVTDVSADPVRRNDYEGAAFLSMHEALGALGLPLPMIFEPPQDGDS